MCSTLCYLLKDTRGEAEDSYFLSKPYCQGRETKYTYKTSRGKKNVMQELPLHKFIHVQASLSTPEHFLDTSQLTGKPETIFPLTGGSGWVEAVWISG